MGRWAVRAALADPKVEALVVADLDGVAAARAAEEAGPRASAATIDVEDEERLRGLLRGHDLVLNTVGPFFRFGPPILRAAIECGCHYLDVCDDWEPTLEMLALTAAARDAGVTAVVGLGASPGVSNLLAVQAIEELERVEEVWTVWSLDGAGSEPGEGGREGPSAATVHGVHQLTGRIRSFEGGALIDRRPMERHELRLPGVDRKHPVWTIGHPESITLPRTYRTLRRSTNAMFTDPRAIRLLRFLTGLVDWRLASIERVAGWVERLETGEGGEFGAAVGPETPLEGLPPLFALAKGTRAGGRASAAAVLAAAPPGGMGPITGIPLGVGASMLAAGQIDRPGVHAPEAVVPPGPFFERLSAWCEPGPPEGRGLAVLTRSWEERSLEEAFEAFWS